MKPVSHNQQLTRNIQLLLEGSPADSIKGPLPTEEAVMVWLGRQGTVRDCFDLHSPRMSASAERTDAISINSLDPCLGLIALDCEDERAYASHSSAEGAAALSELLETLVPPDRLPAISIVTVGQHCQGTFGVLSQAEALRIGGQHGIRPEQFHFRDQVNHARYRELVGMDALVVPAYKAVFVFGERANEEGNDGIVQLLEVLTFPKQK